MDASQRQVIHTNRLSMPPLSQPLTPYSHKNGEANMGMQNYSSLQRRPKPLVNNVPGNSSTLPRNLHKNMSQHQPVMWNAHVPNGHVGHGGQNQQYSYQPRIPMPLQPMKYVISFHMHSGTSCIVPHLKRVRLSKVCLPSIGSTNLRKSNGVFFFWDSQCIKNNLKQLF